MSRTVEHPPAKLTYRQIAAGAVLILAAALVVAFQSGNLNSLPLMADSSPASDQASDLDRQTILPVNARPIEFVESIEQSRNYTGTVRARRRSDLAFELAGKVAEVLIDEGDQVSAGQVIARLDTATLKAQQAAILAQLASACSVMQELEAGPRQETIKAAEADVSAAKSDFENATVRLKRRASLAKAQAIPVEEYDQAKFDVRSSQAQLQSASERLAELKSGTRQERLSAQQASVRQLEASAQEMEVALSKSELTSPYAATVTRRYVDPGSIVQSTLPVCKLVEQSKLEAWVGLPVEVVSKIKIGNEYSVVVGAAPYPVTASAKIGELDPATRTQTVLFEFNSDASKAVVPGQLCQIRIATTVNSSGFWLPNSALAKGVRGLSTVMVLEPAKNNSSHYVTRKRDVVIVKTASDRVLVKGTIVEGDLIVVDGLHRITDGQKVSLAKPAE